MYLDHVARYIEHANHSIVWAEKLGVANCGVRNPNTITAKRQRRLNQINAAAIRASR